MSIAKNTFYFTLALVLQKVLSFSYFIYLARFLGPANLGKYYFAISFASLFSILMDFGVSNVQIRETAKSKENEASEITSIILSSKIILGFFVFLITAISINFTKYDEISRHLVYIASACVILDSFSLTFFSYIRGFQNLWFESLASVWFQVIAMASGFSFIYLGFGLRMILTALLLASIFFFCYSGFLAFYKFDLKFKFDLNKNKLKALSLKTGPFAVYAILQRIYTYIDTVLLAFFAGNIAVGIYQAAFKIINALQFIPGAFTASLYPAFSRYWATGDKEKLAKSLEKALRYLLIISAPIAFGTIAIADSLILIFKQNFEPSIEPLRAIMFGVIFIFLGYPLGSILNACDKQKENARAMTITLVFNIILNLLLIKQFGALGASIAATGAAILMFVLNFLEVNKILVLNKKDMFIYVAKISLATALMFAVIFYLKTKINIFLAGFFGGVIYCVLIFVLKIINQEDLNYAKNIFKK